MKLFVATLACCLFVWSASAEPLPSECRWGASYWCRSQAAARRCGQVDYCQNNVWNKATTTTSDTKVSSSAAGCEVCSVITELARSMMSSSKVEAEAETLIKKACNLMSGEARTECSSIIDDYFNMIWTLVKQGLKNDEICKRVGLCSSTPLTAQQNRVSQDACDLCKLVASFLKPYVDSNATENEAKQALEQLCSILPSTISSTCTSLVKDDFDLVWSVVKTEVDSGLVCKQLGLCNSTRSMKTVVLVQQNHVSDDGLCDMCKMVSTYLKTFVDSSSSESEVKDALDKMCSLLPSSVKDDCTSMVSTYLDLIWTLVKSEVDSGDLCSQIGLCKSTRTMKTRLNKLMLTKPVTLKDGSYCDDCKEVLALIQPTIDSSSTESEVKEFLDKLCSMLPSDVSGTCNSTVNTYFDMIWGIVKAEVDGGQICSIIGLCNSTVSVRARNKPVSKPAAGVECEVCKLVVTELKTLVTDNTTEAEFEKILDGLCENLPAFKSECADFVNQYGPELLQYLQRYIDPSTICTALGLCSNNSMAILLAKQVKAPQGLVCDGCMKMTGEIISALMSDSIETKVEDKLTGICGKLPNKVDNSECQSLLKAFFPIVWKFIKSEVDSNTLEQEACSLIKLCKAPVKTRSIMAPQGPIKCVVCKLIARELGKLVDNNSTKSDIEAALVKVCSIVPARFRNECQSFIKGEGDKIISEILTDGPSVICDALCLLKTEESTALAMPKNTITCDACTEVLELMKNFLTTDQGEAVSLIMDVCDIMPSTVKPECDDFVKSYGPDVVEIIANYIDPKTMCQQFCSTARRFKLISLRAGRYQL